jgi:hypothetical protein
MGVLPQIEMRRVLEESLGLICGSIALGSGRRAFCCVLFAARYRTAETAEQEEHYCALHVPSTPSRRV